MALQKHQLKFATGRLQQDMSNHNAVLEMTPGRKMLTPTATSSYNISWGPDASLLNEHLGGHLVFKTEAFQSIPRRGGGLPPTVLR